jgi:hypothetical protein
MHILNSTEQINNPQQPAKPYVSEAFSSESMLPQQCSTREHSECVINLAASIPTDVKASTGNSLKAPLIDATNDAPSGFILKLYQMVNGAPDEVIMVRGVQIDVTRRLG